MRLASMRTNQKHPFYYVHSDWPLFAGNLAPRSLMWLQRHQRRGPERRYFNLLRSLRMFHWISFGSFFCLFLRSYHFNWRGLWTSEEYQKAVKNGKVRFTEKKPCSSLSTSGKLLILHKVCSEIEVVLLSENFRLHVRKYVPQLVLK